jgi:hypothetical protein
LNRFYIILIILINIFKLLFLITIFYKLNKKSKKIENNLLFYFLIYNTFLYGLVVNVFRFISNAKILGDYQVIIEEVLFVEIIELFSTIIFILIIYLFLISKFNKYRNSNLNINNAFFILTVINILCICNFFISDYYNQLLFGEVFKYLSAPSAVILSFYSFYYKRFRYLIISLIHLGLVLFLIFSTGVRGPIVGIVLIIFFLYINHYSYKKVLKKIPILIIPIILLILLNKEYSKLKSAFTTEYLSNPQAYQSILDIGEYVINYYTNDSSEYIEGNESSGFDEIEFRLGARSMYSVGFLRFTKNWGYTYFTPIVNTFYVFAPRAFFNVDKPYPDSYNGEEYGMGMYVCVDEVDHKIYMTDFYASSHYFWQFGFIGVIVLSIISTFYIIFVLLLSRKMHSIIKLLFIIFALKPFYFIPQFTFSDIVLMIVTKIIPFLILLTILNFFSKFKIRQ